MRIARFSHNDAIRFGIVDQGELVVLAGDPMFAGYETTGERVPLADVALLAPVIPRSKLVCVGRNYRDHAAEARLPVPETPVVFAKASTAVIGSGEPIVLPASHPRRVDYEAELGVVVVRDLAGTRVRCRSGSMVASEALYKEAVRLCMSVRF